MTQKKRITESEEIEMKRIREKGSRLDLFSRGRSKGLDFDQIRRAEHLRMWETELRDIEYKRIKWEKKGNICTITLNRPEKVNAIDVRTTEELIWAVHQAEVDDDVKVVILKGAGGNFAAGYDLQEVGWVYGIREGKAGERRATQRARLHVDRHQQEHLSGIFNCYKPTIAQVEGIAIGGGLYITECCDITVCAKDAKLGHAEQRLGFAGATFTFPLEVMLVGYKKARELLLIGHLISGEEAERIGLVNKAVPRGELAGYVDRMAQAIALQPRDGIAIGKAYAQLVYEQLGLGGRAVSAYILHSMFTNLSFEDDEYSFFKMRREHGARKAFHDMNERYRRLGYADSL